VIFFVIAFFSLREWVTIVTLSLPLFSPLAHILVDIQADNNGAAPVKPVSVVFRGVLKER